MVGVLKLSIGGIPNPLFLSEVSYCTIVVLRIIKRVGRSEYWSGGGEWSNFPLGAKHFQGPLDLLNECHAHSLIDVEMLIHFKEFPAGEFDLLLPIVPRHEITLGKALSARA